MVRGDEGRGTLSSSMTGVAGECSVPRYSRKARFNSSPCPPILALTPTPGRPVSPLWTDRSIIHYEAKK